MKTSVVKKIIMLILNAFGLHIEENNTITDNDKVLKHPQACNNKPVLLDYDPTKSIFSNYILLKLDSNFVGYSYFFFDKYIHSVLESKINFLFVKLIKFVSNPELHNKSKSENLNALLLQLYKENDFEIDDTTSKSLSDKWETITKILEKQALHDSLIKLSIKFDFVRLEDQNDIKACGISDIEKDEDYIYSQSYITASFPMYQLLKEAKNSKVLGIDLSKNELIVLLGIYQYIFNGINDQSSYRLLVKPLWKELSDKNEKVNIVESKPLPDTLVLLKSFVTVTKRIDTVIDEISFLDDMNDKSFNLSDVDTLIDNIEKDQPYPPQIDFENKFDVLNEKKRYKSIDLNTLNKSLNETSFPNNIQEYKSDNRQKNYKTKYRRSNYKPMRQSFLSMSPSAAFTIQGFNAKNEILDPTNENFDQIISPTARLYHRHTTAGSGSGKSEGLKAMALKDFQDKESSFVLVDGGQKLALELAKLVDDPSRLVYIDESLSDKHYFSINPVDPEDKSAKNLAIMSKHLAKSFELLMESSWSTNMEPTLISVLYILMEQGGFDIFDLKRFMNESNYDELQELASKSSNKIHRDFIINDFNRIKSIKSTRDAIYMKLQNLVSDGSLEKCITGKSTINIEKLLNTPGKIIIVKPESTAFGILFMAMVQGIVEKRDVHNFIHTYISVDEFQNYVSPSSTKILSEQRKKGLHLTMAHQELDQIKDIRSNIFSNTDVKIVGKNSYENLKIMSKEIQVDIKELENLGLGEFYIKVGTNKAIKIKVTDKFIDKNGSMSDEEWEKCIIDQLEKYYEPLKDKIESIDSKNNSASVMDTNSLVPETDEF